MAVRVVQTLSGKDEPPPTDLSFLVGKMCDNLKIVYEPTKKEALNSAEQEKADSTHFPEDLNFQVDPKLYLLESKKAFNLFISGLNEDMRFNKLMELIPHDPKRFPYQMGEGTVDVQPLQS